MSFILFKIPLYQKILSNVRPESFLMSEKGSSSNDQTLFNERVAEILQIEEQLNAKWEESRIYEQDAPLNGDSSEHYTVTFPFPYMNGRLHLGHLFTVSKAEFAVRYQRMLGKKALFPFGFHCTGMPIKASADKLAFELDNGFEAKTEPGKVLKSKVASKTISGKSQFDIMRSMGVPEDEIAEFRNPDKWLQYFPPLGISDLKMYGAAVDWRRSFITTHVNPYFDKFVRWQFNHLHRLGYVKFGKRATICSLKDQQPCMDHDRSSGEGVQPQEYTLIKLRLVNPHLVSENFRESDEVYLLAATLRPETMIGQTNYWIKPDVEYDVVKAKNSNELYVSGTRAVQNMAVQDIIESAEPLFKIESNKLIGAEATSACINHVIRGFPMESILMNKGTGIVTSVPSDAPADYQSVVDLRKNKPMLEKYHINPDWLKFDFIYIISTAKYGMFSAEGAIKEIEAQVPKNTPKAERLELAKNLAYKEGFYKGVMEIGPYKGQKVQEAKDAMKQSMVDQNAAIVYYEPESVVISRSGDECVVMFCDQWYINYGLPEWKQPVLEHFEKMNIFHEEIKEKFLKCFDWLGPWACSRQFGLGTRLPFGEEFLIDSLSDSTIYTAFYTIAHLLQGNLDGSVPGLANISPDLINDDFFECVFRNGPIPNGIPESTIEKIKNEFQYFYPVNVRVSGKDLVTNHLTMFMYNHAAIFEEKYWPLGIRANGFLNLNNQKMSKSTGNFLTVIDAIRKYSSSATRIALADGGDGAVEANFTEDVAKSAVHRFFNMINLIKNPPANMRNDISGFFDTLLDAQISRSIIETQAAYEKMNYKSALKSCFFDLQNAWTDYNTSMEGTSVSEPLYHRYIDVSLLLLTPIAPHFTDYCWMQLLGHSTTIVNERFPTPNKFDSQLFFMERLMNKTADNIRFRIKALAKKFKKLNSLAIFVENKFNNVQERILQILRDNFNQETRAFNDEAVDREVASDATLKDARRDTYMPFLKFYRTAVPEFGSFLLSPIPEIDQVSLFANNKNWFLKQFKDVTEIEIFSTPIQTETQFDSNIINSSQVYVPSADLTLKQ